MIEQIVLGIIQGITEWLPISSEGALVLAQVNFFQSEAPLRELVSFALFLHLGTFLAALVYFWRDVLHLSKHLVFYSRADQKTKATLRFIAGATSVTGVVALAAFSYIGDLEHAATEGRVITALVGIMLLATAAMQFSARKGEGRKRAEQTRPGDWIFTGVAQGLAIIPGVSRSGMTVSAMLMRKVEDTTALRLSFLMSLPVVLLGNIVINAGDFIFRPVFLWGLAASFLFGLLTIKGLLQLAERVNFAWFVLFFAVLVLIAVFI